MERGAAAADFAGPSHGGAKAISASSGQTLPPLRVARREASDEFESNYVRKLVEITGGNRKAAATMADVSREMIRKLLLKHELE